MKVRELPEAVLDYLSNYEYRKRWADEDTYRNIAEELTKFGYSLKDKSCIGDYNSLQGYLGLELLKKGEKNETFRSS